MDRLLQELDFNMGLKSRIYLTNVSSATKSGEPPPAFLNTTCYIPGTHTVLLGYLAAEEVAVDLTSQQYIRIRELFFSFCSFL
jgi:hypothetical protein